jgi:hypothetical protein
MSLRLLNFLFSFRIMRPLCIGVAVFSLALIHQSNNEASVVGVAQVMRDHAKTSCFENGHSMMRWFIDSSTWSHMEHVGLFWRRLLSY